MNGARLLTIVTPGGFDYLAELAALDASAVEDKTIVETPGQKDDL